MATGTSALMISSKDLSMLQTPILNEGKLNKVQEVRNEIVDNYNTIEQLNNTINELNESWLKAHYSLKTNNRHCLLIKLSMAKYNYVDKEQTLTRKINVSTSIQKRR